MKRIAALSVFLLSGFPAEAQDSTPDTSIRKYLAARATDLERDFLPGVKTAEDFEKLRPRLREEYFYSLGLWGAQEKTPLNATVTGTLEFPDFTVEKLHFQSRPGLYVTANLYVPIPAKGPYPAIVYACGHSNMKRDGNKTAYQDQGIWFASHGYVALVYDTLQLGEIGAIHHGTYREQRWWWHSAGYTPAGVECLNAIRSIDYLETRPEVDKTRIGASGISGGGAATFWIAAADERIKAAVPVSGMADLGYYVSEDGVNGHCDCMFAYNPFRWNWTTIAALVCPRPLLFANSDDDKIFPMSANERIINRLERLYARFGASDHVDALVSIGGHAYRTDLRRAAFEFLNRHLKGDSRRVEDPDMGLGPDPKTRRIPPEDLRVFPKDSDIPPDQLNTKIDETFVPMANHVPPRSPEQFERRRKDVLADLRRVSFGAWPSAPDPSLPAQETERGIEVSFTTVPAQTATKPKWIVVLNLDEDARETPPWAREIIGNEAAFLLKPRGGWTRKNPPNTVERSLALLGQTADSGRVWDVLAFAELRGGPFKVAGRGAAGLLGAYAALYTTKISELVLADPPASHRPPAAEAPAILNVLRVADVPELLGCLAPRRLVLLRATDAAFDRIAAFYRAAGATDRLERP